MPCVAVAIHEVCEWALDAVAAVNSCDVLAASIEARWRGGDAVFMGNVGWPNAVAVTLGMCVVMHAGIADVGDRRVSCVNDGWRGLHGGDTGVSRDMHGGPHGKRSGGTALSCGKHAGVHACEVDVSGLRSRPVRT